MKTYSDRLAPLRAFLKVNRAYPGDTLRPTEIEKWEIDGRPLLILKNEDGAWGAYTPIAFSDSETSRLDLERFLAGRRPDLDLLENMASICDRFLIRLSEFPACNDADCGQRACSENRQLRSRIEDFRAHLLSVPAKEKSHVPA